MVESVLEVKSQRLFGADDRGERICKSFHGSCINDIGFYLCESCDVCLLAYVGIGWSA